MNPATPARGQAALARVTRELLAERTPDGHWVGELSSSALSTATAIVALKSVGATVDASAIQRGLQWLAANANADGGWGDTLRSPSNLSTTALVWAAFGAAQADVEFARTVAGATGYIEKAAGSVAQVVPAIEARYGRDRTFSVPITMTLALSGRLGPNGWRRVRPLPFELAALPREFFGALRLPVVSYALPALIAIGQVIQHHAPRWNPLRRWVRNRTLAVLTTLQPPNGGFLEATPLTSFVTMSLAGMGLAGHRVAELGASFLRNSVRSDGSWPIDTNLATWGTTLAVKALRHQPGALTSDQRGVLRRWILQQQFQAQHPYTGAAPGGWAWTDLPGGVPDADDTAGALLALAVLRESGTTVPLPEEERRAARAGVAWLMGLQNGDGGIPTFCRGWGTLPFDRSTPEVTAHVLRAWSAWLPHLPESQQRRIQVAARRALRYLARVQRADGAWIPLWFGSETAPDQLNPVYGTAQVLAALGEIRATGWTLDAPRKTAAGQFLRHAQHAEGGWGGAPGVPPTVEETALALTALLNVAGAADAVARGVDWLARQWTAEAPVEPAPIGLYFAQLWYFERLYPLLFSADALGQWLAQRSD